MVGVARVPLILLQRTAVLVPACCLARAWMEAIAEIFPDIPLGELRSKDPSLLPPWLLKDFDIYNVRTYIPIHLLELKSRNEDVLVLRRGGIFARSLDARKVCCTSPSILAATSTCRFREGYASEGMLCNNPPIPLRVLDFLDDAQDLLSLALVCKATHQAGHVLLQREFPCGLGRVLAAFGMGQAIKRRKRSMLESALRHPIRSSTASASMLAAETASMVAAEAGAEACSATHGDAVFFVSGSHGLSLEMDRRCWDELDFCLSMLLRASEVATACPSRVKIAHPPLDWLPRDGGSQDDWQEALQRLLEKGIVMDTAAVGRAIAQWSEVHAKNPDRSSGRAAIIPERVMRVVRAAERHGQRVIVHDECLLVADWASWVFRSAVRG